MCEIIYENEGAFSADSGDSLLTTSLKNSVPHMHVCGGNARCSTCRVAVLEGMENLSAAEEAETSLMRKKQFASNMRLACQAKITGPVKLRRLVLDETDADIVVSTSGPPGHEERLAILFSDLRDFTPFSERQLPYDLVHILNRYFRAMGEAVIENDGRIDKYIGDGMMALFGTNDDEDVQKCRRAARAALDMQRSLEDVNAYVSQHFGETLRMGIGLHFGRVIVGEVGHPKHREFTALGDAVNMASRIEGVTRRAGAAILASEDFMEHAREAIRIGRIFSTRLKGKDGRFKVFELAGCNDNPSDLTVAMRRHLKEKIPLTLAPALLRLAFHEAMTRNAIGSSLSDEEATRTLLEREEHAGLEPAVRFVRETMAGNSLTESLLPSDLIYMCGAVAVEVAGGPFIPVQLPVQKRRNIDGKTQVPGIPRETEVFSALMIRFRRAGLDRRQMVALCGAHTLGKAHGRPFTDDPYRFDNEYFKRLHREDLSLSLALLPSDRELLHDERAREMVELYAKDEEAFFRDFRDAYIALIEA